MNLKVNSNIISGVVFLGLSILILVIMPQQIEVMQEGSINAQTIPRLVAIVMMVCSISLLIQGIFFSEKKSVSFNRDNVRKELRGIIMIAIFIGYGAIIDFAGFLISSLLLSIACLLFFKVKNWKFYVATFAAVFIIYYSFAYALNVNLP